MASGGAAAVRRAAERDEAFRALHDMVGGEHSATVLGSNGRQHPPRRRTAGPESRLSGSSTIWASRLISRSCSPTRNRWRDWRRRASRTPHPPGCLGRVGSRLLTDELNKLLGEASARHRPHSGARATTHGHRKDLHISLIRKAFLSKDSEHIATARQRTFEAEGTCNCGAQPDGCQTDTFAVRSSKTNTIAYPST